MKNAVVRHFRLKIDVVVTAICPLFFHNSLVGLSRNMCPAGGELNMLIARFRARAICVRNGLPLNQFQIHYEDGIQDRHKQQRDKGRNGQTTDLGITQGLPEWASMHGERYESQHGRTDRNHHRAKSHNSSIEECLSQWFSSLASF